MKLSVSIVTFNNEDVIENALESIKKSNFETSQYRIIVVDNSSTDKTREIITEKFPKVTLFQSKNNGFGCGHNIAIKKIIDYSDFHLVMNPDVYFSSEVLKKLIKYLENNCEVGLLMPKILYPDQKIQYLCKKLPTPLDLIGRRFIPDFLKFIFKKRFEKYEYKDNDYNKIMQVPHLSGCFMMLRTEVFKKVGLFDERFFMYLEDVDFSRRVLKYYKNIYYPEAAIFHLYHKGSYKKLKHLKYHIVSAVNYFNKWGWFRDPERRKINNI